MKNINIIQNDNYIEVQKLCKTHVMSDEISFNTIAWYSYTDKKGSIHQYSGMIPKEYKSLINWKKAVKRIFDIDL